MIWNYYRAYNFGNKKLCYVVFWRWLNNVIWYKCYWWNSSEYINVKGKTIWAQLLFLKEIIRYKDYMKSVKVNKNNDGIRWIKLLDKI